MNEANPITLPDTDTKAWYESLNLALIMEYATPVIGVLLLLFFGWIIAGWASRLTRRGMMKAKVDETLSKFTAKAVKWVLLIFVILTALTLFGVEVTSFAALIAARQRCFRHVP